MQIISMNDGLSILDDGRVRAFLIEGEDRALLIDTGFEDNQVFEAVKSCTGLPVTVLLTHGDLDHAGGLAPFGACYAMEADWPMISKEITIHPMNEGDVFACGAWHLEVIAIPGHTPGSAAFFDREKGVLISGDSIQKGGPIYMFGPHRNLERYIESQRKLLPLLPRIRMILPSHNSCPIEADCIAGNLQDALALQAGTLPAVPHPQLPCQVYQGQWTSFLY